MSAWELFRRVAFAASKELALALADKRPAPGATPSSPPSGPLQGWRVETLLNGERKDLGTVEAMTPQSAAEKAVACHVESSIAATEKFPPARWDVVVTPGAGGAAVGVCVVIMLKVEAMR